MPALFRHKSADERQYINKSSKVGRPAHLNIDFDYLRAAGKDVRHQIEPMHRYGESLTDKDLLDVPRPLLRNVRSAPSTPEMESKSLPRHAESTSQLEMQTPSKKAHSKSPSPDLNLSRKSPHKGSRRMSKSRYEKFHRLFKSIPEGEVPINYYSCAYFGDILLQGYLYVSANYICFYSKILGKEKLIEIPISKIVKITRERTAFIIPNAIGIVTAMEKYVFGSLMARDSTYTLMCKLWKLQADGEISSLSTKYDSEPDTSTVSPPVKELDAVDSNNDNNGQSNPKIKLTIGSSAESSSVESMDISPSPSRCSHCRHRDQISPQGGVDIKKTDLQSSINHKTSPKIYTSNKSFVFQCLDNSTTYKAMNQLVTKVQRLPRTSLLLGICSLLVLFLTISALMMLYKILLLQAQLDSGVTWGENNKAYNRNQYHSATIERFHSVLQANLQILDQVHESLKKLKGSSSSYSVFPPTHQDET